MQMTERGCYIYTDEGWLGQDSDTGTLLIDASRDEAQQYPHFGARLMTLGARMIGLDWSVSR